MKNCHFPDTALILSLSKTVPCGTMRTHVTHFEGKTNPILWSHLQQEENCRWYSFVYCCLKEDYAWDPVVQRSRLHTSPPGFLLHSIPNMTRPTPSWIWTTKWTGGTQHDGYDVNCAKDSYKRTAAFIYPPFLTNATIYKTQRWTTQYTTEAGNDDQQNKWIAQATSSTCQSVLKQGGEGCRLDIGNSHEHARHARGFFSFTLVGR